MTKLVIGIGNPTETRFHTGPSPRDEQYKETRHNVGFMFLEHLAKKLGANDFEFEKKSNSFVSKIKIEKTTVILVKPQTYVNKSGEAVLKLSKLYKIKPTGVIIIQDDLDVPFGNVKISFDKNSGGHKGIESIMRALKTKKFYRLRIGLGTRALAKARALSDSRRDEFVRNYVLSKFSPSEKEQLKEILKAAYDKLLLIT